MKIIQLLIFLLAIPFFVAAQDIEPNVVASAGDSYLGNSTQLDWTLGEIAIRPIEGAYQITQGFHQPYYTIVMVNELPKKIGNVELFPNPTTDYLDVRMNFEENRAVEVRLYDTQGKLIRRTEKEGRVISMKFSLLNLPQGVYFLNFTIDKDQYQETYKIEKL